MFAQLIVDGESHGVHALVVPLRDEHGYLCDRVRIEDCGEKMGLNGVDNGSIWFDGVRVPREALLNRYADVNDEGRYTSQIESANRRFFTMVGALVQTASASRAHAAKNALASGSATGSGAGSSALPTRRRCRSSTTGPTSAG